MSKWTREQIIEAAKQTAAGHNGPMSKGVFCRRSGIGEYHLYRLFPQGGWGEVCQLAGLARHPCNMGRITDEQLLQEFHRVVCEVGAIPSWMHFASLARLGHSRIRKRFGSKRATLARYREWLLKNDPDSPLLQLLPNRAPHAAEATAGKGNLRADEPQGPKAAGILYGPPLNFRGMRHAPTNEQGVVYLFGMVSSELGLMVEALRPSYPDCEAKRCVDVRQNRWQTVQIEFEYTSSKFRDHGHDPAGCDLIVCWVHDWAECPLEVIELRAVIADLKG